MPIDPQRALEGYVRALSYSSHDLGPEHEPAAGPVGTPQPGSGPEPGTAEPERSVPAPASAPAPAPAARSGPGILLRLLSLRRAPATAEETRRA
ncbi:hypothetical protein [Streptomyces sp. NPDC007100]|uniref:hypothetical protein n=1 Tax=unclassified Streptomyces TaxID=2593676 RepID=UPI0033F058E2